MHKFSSYIEDDIDYLREIETDEGEPSYTRSEAIIEVYLRMEENNATHERKYKNEISEYLIDLGVYKFVTEEQLARCVITSGRKYDLKLGGCKYKFISWLPLAMAEN